MLFNRSIFLHLTHSWGCPLTHFLCIGSIAIIYFFTWQIYTCTVFAKENIYIFILSHILFFHLQNLTLAYCSSINPIQLWRLQVRTQTQIQRQRHTQTQPNSTVASSSEDCLLNGTCWQRHIQIQRHTQIQTQTQLQRQRQSKSEEYLLNW